MGTKLIRLFCIVGFMSFGLWGSAQIRFAKVESADLFERFERVYISCEKSDSFSVSFSILNPKGDTLISSFSTRRLIKGENSRSLGTLVDSLTYSDSDIRKLCKSTSGLPPGQYLSLFKVGILVAQQSFRISPTVIDITVERTEEKIEHGADAIIFSIPVDSLMGDFVRSYFHWSYVDQPLDTSSAEISNCRHLVRSSGFTQDNPIVYWITQEFGSYAVGKSKKEILIPNSSQIALPELHYPKELPNGLQLEVPTIGVSLLKRLRQNVKPYGSMGTDFFFGNNQYSSNRYGRGNAFVQGSAGLDISGFPIKMNLLVSWYEYTGLQLFDIGFELDFDRFRSNMQQSLRDKVEAQKLEVLKYPGLSIDFDTLRGSLLEGELKKLETEYKPDELAEVKQRLADVSPHLDQVPENIDGQQYKTLGEHELRKESEGLENDAKNSIDESSQSIADSALTVSQGTRNEYVKLKKREGELDSLKRLYQSKKKDYARFKKILGQYNELKSKGIDVLEPRSVDYNDPDVLVEFLPERFKKHGKTLLKVQSFEMGWAHVDFSDFTIKNKAINGLNFEYKGDNLGLKTFKGQTNNGFNHSGPSPLGNSHSTSGLNLGAYRNGRSEVLLNYVSFTDRREPFALHQKNAVLSLQANQMVYNGVWVISELARSNSVSLNNAAYRGPDQTVLGSLLDFDNSTAQAHSMGVQYRSEDNSSDYSAKLFRVGSAFQTLGNPFVVNDRKGIQLAANKRLLKNRLFLTAAYAYETNNLSRQYADTGLFRRYQLGMVVRVFSKVNLSVFYVPVSADFGGLKNRIHTLNTTMDISDKVGSVKVTVQGNHSLQVSSFDYVDLQNQETEVVSLNAYLLFRKGNEFRLGGALSTPRSFFKQTRAEVSYTYSIKRQLRHSLFSDLYMTNLYGDRYFLGTGLEFKLMKFARIGVKTGYSLIQRSEASSLTGGVEVRANLNVAF